MSTNHLAMRPSTRLSITLLAALSMIAAQMALFLPQATAESDGWKLNRLVLEFDDGSFFDSDVDPWVPAGGQGSDVIVYPDDVPDDADDDANRIHISCSEDQVGKTVYRIDDSELVTLTVTDFWLNADNPGEGDPGDRDCTPLDEFPTISQLDVQVTKTNDANEDGVFTDTETASAAGNDVEFQVEVKNTGDVAAAVTTFTDTWPTDGSLDLLGDDSDLITCEDFDLATDTIAPDETITCTFTVTDYAPAAGESLTNTVDVTISEDDGDLTANDSDTSTVNVAEVVLPPDPEILLDKSAVDGVTEDDEGNLTVTLDDEDGSATVTYEFVVTNTGDDDLTDLTLVDDKIGDLTDALTDALEDATLPVDESVTVTADHEVTADDFDGITLTNVVEVVGVGVDSGAPVDDSDDETVTLVEVLDTAEELPETGLNTAGLTGLGLLLAMIGAASLLLTSPRREEDAS